MMTLDAERAGRGDLAIGRAAAAVLGDDDLDPVRDHQRALVGFAERPARGDVDDMRQRQRRIDRIDAADQIKMLRRFGERREFVAAERDEYAARRSARACAPRRAASSTSVQRSPATATQGGRRSATNGTSVLRAAAHGVGRNDAGIGMRGVDQRVDALADEIIGKPAAPPKPPTANRHGLRAPARGAAGERQRHVEIARPARRSASSARFRGAAENEDAWHAAS